MTAVVRRACQHAFAEFELVKITAHAFSHNTALARVLEKCGFQEEGVLRKHFLKDGQSLDARRLALLKEEAQAGLGSTRRGCRSRRRRTRR